MAGKPAHVENRSRDRTAEETGACAPPTLWVIAMAASMGGLEALTQILSALPAGFGAPIVVVQHLSPEHRSLMSEILGRRTSLRVKQAEDGERLCAGTVYVAPPDQHVLIQAQGTLSLSHSPEIHFVRPSADPLFESLAASYGARAIAVVLTGAGSDGSTGIRAVKRSGGITIAQNEKTSASFSMPRAAIQTGSVDFVLALDEIAPRLVALTGKR